MSRRGAERGARTRAPETQTSDLRAFAAVVEHGSFSRAAEALGISQPTISQRLQNLEQHLGLKLVERRRGAVPTEMGQRLYTHARRLLTELDGFEAAARELEGLRRGHLRVGFSTPPFAMTLLGRFRRVQPAVRLSLVQGTTFDLQEKLLRSEIDAAVMTLMAPPAEPLAHVRLAPQRLAAVVPAGHPLAGGGPVPWARIVTEPILLRRKPSVTHAQIEAELRARDLALDAFLELPSREAVKEAVAEGLGVGLAFASEIGRDARIAAVEIADADAACAVYVATQPEIRGLPAVAAFLDIAAREGDDAAA